MSIGGALELIQSFNNPKIIDDPDSSLQEGKLHSRWKLLTVLRDFIQLPKLFIKMEDKLFSSTFKIIIWNSTGDILGESSFSEAPLEDVLMCSLSSF